MRNADNQSATRAKARKRWSAAVATALAVAAATTGAALAASPYTLKLTVPKNPSSSTFTVKATGNAATTSQVVAYIGDKPCASTPKLEATPAARRVVNKTVSGTYTASKSARVGSVGTTHRVCAYLTSTNGSVVRARAATTYTPLSGAY